MRLSVNAGTTRLLDFFEDEVYYYFVTEIESGGSLAKHLRESGTQITESKAREISLHLA
jgi:hypothetical protein